MNQPVEYKVTKVLNTATAWQTGLLEQFNPFQDSDQFVQGNAEIVEVCGISGQPTT